MELQKFIETTLQEVTAGLHNSNKMMIDAATGKGISDSDYMKVDFDIAVTTTKESEGDMNGKVAVLSIFSLGGSLAQKDGISNVSRIKFSVFVKLNTLNQKNVVVV